MAAITLAAGTVGLAARRPEVLLFAVLGVVYAAYPRLTAAPRVDLELDRRTTPSSSRPGGEVRVEVTVRNRGNGPVADLRVVDGVPPALPVVDGTPRHGTALRAGESTTFSYAVGARHGRHRFEPATVVCRDVSGAHERRTTIEEDTELACTTTAGIEPRSRRTTVHAGRVVGSTGGAGVEFDRSREYRSGDPAKRIDWNRYARRRELTTVLYREERAATVVAVVDARPPSYRGGDGGPNAISASVSATEQLAADLVENRNRVGVAALGWPDAWIPPDTGRDHLVRVRERLATDRAFAPYPPDEEPRADVQLSDLRARMPDDGQVLLFTPLCDGWVVDAARTLEADGYPTTVVSPDVTGRDSPGRRLAAVERDNRLSGLRRAGTRVIDWRPTVPLAAALQAHREAIRA